jgi:hypothetical protein
MKFRITHSVIVRSPGLLPMLYKVSELAEELDIHPRTLYDWLKQGAPHQRDDRDHIWINGQEFAGWVDSVRKKSIERLQDDEGYCLRCQCRVRVIDTRIIGASSYCRCITCGGFAFA